MREMRKLKRPSILSSADSYKLSHADQLVENTEMIYENFTPRSLKHLNKKYRTLTKDKLVVFGLQQTIQQLVEAFDEDFFSQDFDVAVSRFVKQSKFFTSGRYNVNRLRELHELGFLPLKVKTLKEGTLVSPRIPLLTIRNTHGQKYAWVLGFLETYISNETWKKFTNATIAFSYRLLLEQAARETVGHDTSFVLFQGHDFSARGMCGSHDASQSGVAHLASFLGSDSVGATSVAIDYYGCGEDEFIASSICASEHMTETLAIQYFAKKLGVSLQEAEYHQMKRFITEVYPSGIVARVSDSYDYWNVITNIVPRLKEEILNRPVDEMGLSKVVIRPDSGDPVDIICGEAIPVRTITDIERLARSYKEGDSFWVSNTKNPNGVWNTDYIRIDVKPEGLEQTFFLNKDVPPEVKGTVECLWETFGGTMTQKGYRLLDSHIGMIYGDSITINRAEEIVNRLKEKGFASTNTALGIGSYTYQYSTRDTTGSAIKATYAVVDGIGIDLNKDPKTDDGTKKSAKGLLRVEFDENGEYVLLEQQTPEQEEGGELKTIFEDGVFTPHSTLASIREEINKSVEKYLG